METIIVPDTHLRDFWKILKNDTTERTIVFLGDYLDPYHHVSAEDAADYLLELFQWAEDNSHRVKLLQGNHCQFYRDKYKYCCRHYTQSREIFAQIYKEYSHLLNFAYKENNAIFTHAGITDKWIQHYDLQFLNEDNVTDYLNSEPDTLWKIGRSRGGRDFASCPLWACWYGDWPYCDNPFSCTQIFGHSQLELDTPIHDVDNRIINTDCRQVLVWDGINIKHYEQKS